MSAPRWFTRVLTDRNGVEVTIKVSIDEGAPLDRCIQRLANRARSLRASKVASTADGVIRVMIVHDPVEDRPKRVKLGGTS